MLNISIQKQYQKLTGLAFSSAILSLSSSISIDSAIFFAATFSTTDFTAEIHAILYFAR